MIDELYTAMKAKLPVGTPFYLGAENVVDGRNAPRIIMTPDYEELSAGGSSVVNGQPQKVSAKRIVYIQFFIFAVGYSNLETLTGATLEAAQSAARVNLSGSRVDYGTADTQTSERFARVTVGLEAVYTTADTFAKLTQIINDCGGE